MASVSNLQKFLKMLQRESAGVEAAPGIMGKLEHLGDRGIAAGKKGYQAMKDSPGAALMGAGLGAGGMAAYKAMDGDEDDEVLKRLLESRGY